MLVPIIFINLQGNLEEHLHMGNNMDDFINCLRIHHSIEICLLLKICDMDFDSNSNDLFVLLWDHLLDYYFAVKD